MLDRYNSTQAKSLSAYLGYAPKAVLYGKGPFLYSEREEEYLDTGMALGSVTLGYARKEVDAFVIKNIRKGVNFSRPSALEEVLTEKLQSQFSYKIVARYAKSSSLLLSVIPRIARALTGKTLIAYPERCFLGNTDWYLSKYYPSGILPAVSNNVVTFQNGNIEELMKLFEKNSSRLSCIVMEPFRDQIFSKEFYTTLSSLCKKHSVLLVFDETVTGYRFHYPFAQFSINCSPDFTIIGKALANGYSIASVVASEDFFVEIEKDKSLFGFSTTHAGETVGLAGAIKTIEIYEELRVVEKLNSLGSYLISGLQKVLEENMLGGIIQFIGQPTYFKMQFSHSSNQMMESLIKYFFANKILFKGNFSISISHRKKELDRIIEVFRCFCNSSMKGVIS